MRKYILLASQFLIVTGFLLFIHKSGSAVGSASLYLKTTCGPAANQITASIYENSGSTQVNAVQADLSYSSSQFGVMSVNLASGWSIAQNDTSIPGSVLFAAFPAPAGSNFTGEQLVGTVVFQAKTNIGLANVAFANTSQVIESSGNTNILTSKVQSTYPLNLVTSCSSPSATDSLVAHPSGTLVALNGRVYLANTDSNGIEVKSLITNGDVFTSYGYPWSQVKTGTNGDSNLPPGLDINSLAPGTIFTSTNLPVYIMTYEGGNLVKQQISLSAFNSLGYSWGQVQSVSISSVPTATASTTLFANQNPAGTLVSGNGKVYLLDQTSKRWILGPDAFTTNNFSWGKVKAGTAADLALPDGTPVDLRQGNMLINGGGIYVVDYDNTGIFKHPVGPWACYANRWHYSYSDLYQIPSSALPSRTGSIATC